MNSKESSFTKQQFDAALAETIKGILVNKNLSPVPEPRAFLLGGQSGAGKSALHRILGRRLDGNVAVVNGDEYRRTHPRFLEIQDRYGEEASAHTAKWAGAMTEALVNVFSSQRYNLIVEGTLRTSEVPLRTAALLCERGYGVSLAIMAAKPEISLLSCQIRYEMMRIAGTTPRATNPVHHSRIVRDIVGNLAALEQSGQFDEILVYDRAGRQIFPADASAPTASETLREAIFGPWSEEELRHREHLQAWLDDLRN